MPQLKLISLSDKNLQSKWKYVIGAYTLDFKNSYHSRVDTKLLNFISYYFIVSFIILSILSLSFFSYLAYYKLNNPETTLSKYSTLSIVVPSVSKDTISDINNEQQLVQAGLKDEADIKARRLVFIPALLFLPIVFIICFIHELGHYLMARKAGIIIDSYGIGMLHIFCIPILPIAYVQPNKDSLTSASTKDYLSMISAGVSVNLTFGIFFLCLCAFINSKFLLLLGELSIGIAMFNSLPLLILDGGQFTDRLNKYLHWILSTIVVLILLILLFL
jgi:Zn-dependent protease